MRFGKITQIYPKDMIQPLVNIGDIIQTIAIEYIYDSIGIPETEILGVSKYNLGNYHGEKLLVPITGFFNERPDMGEVPFSDDIVPVFLGYHSGWGLHNNNTVEYFKNNQPIGCRDKYTKTLLKKHGISAYVCGCPTIVFPRRDKTPEIGKVFFVDAPEEIKDYAPDRILENCEWFTHIVNVKSTPLSEPEYNEIVQHTHDVLNKYKNEAQLVVTSRIHCALPCIAMGIPTIFTTSNLMDVNEFVGNLLNIYTPKDYENIDWNPKPSNIESIKSEFLKLAKINLQCKLEQYRISNSLDNIYERYVGEEYYASEIAKLSILFPTGNEKYIIWGVGSLGSKLYQIMQRHYPRAELLHCCDSYSDYGFSGTPVIRPDQLPPPQLGVRILNATSYGIVESMSKLNSMGYVKGADYDSFFVLPGVMDTSR